MQLKALRAATIALFAFAVPGVPAGMFLAVTISPWFAAIPAVIGVCGSALYAWSTHVKRELQRQFDENRVWRDWDTRLTEGLAETQPRRDVRLPRQKGPQ